MLLSMCPTCGSKNLIKKPFDHEVKGGNNIAFVEVIVESCEDCGEILFTPDQIMLFEKVREELKNNNTQNFIHIGETFRFAS